MFGELKVRMYYLGDVMIYCLILRCGDILYLREVVGFLEICFGILGSVVLKVLILSVVKVRILDENCIFLGNLNFNNYQIDLRDLVRGVLRSLLDVLIDIVENNMVNIIKIDID